MQDHPINLRLQGYPLDHLRKKYSSTYLAAAAAPEAVGGIGVRTSNRAKGKVNSKMVDEASGEREMLPTGSNESPFLHLRRG